MPPCVKYIISDIRGAEEGAEKVAYPTRRFPQWLKPP
jgi:hypothetical protein